MAGARPLSTLALGIALGAATLPAPGCQRERLGLGSGGAPAWLAPTRSARRPARRYLLTREGERCEAYWQEPSGESSRGGPALPCPRTLEPGERIELVGLTCLRDGAPARRVPVVCPSPLLDLAYEDRTKPVGGTGSE